MREQSPSFARFWCIAALSENDMLPRRVSYRIYLLGRCRRLRAGMHPRSAEIMPEPRLEVASRCGIERLPRRTEHLMYDAGHLAGGALRACRLFLKFFLFLLAGDAFATDLR